MKQTLNSRIMRSFLSVVFKLIPFMVTAYEKEPTPKRKKKK